MVPSRGIHTIGLRFAIDVIYLDAQMRVIHIVENLGPLRIAPIRWQCASVLELPARSLYGSGTQVGDQLLICSSQSMLEYWSAQHPDESLDLPAKDEPIKEAPPSAARRAI